MLSGDLHGVFCRCCKAVKDGRLMRKDAMVRVCDVLKHQREVHRKVPNEVVAGPPRLVQLWQACNRQMQQLLKGLLKEMWAALFPRAQDLKDCSTGLALWWTWHGILRAVAAFNICNEWPLHALTQVPRHRYLRTW